ncbi:hypothetical protein PN462_13760 [Spirulina sp. CS-785/01]|uniref:McrC family protein n=1 Tax=Spirulina sp. CS-785/01 TaxID=3021716 RepID=UPI00232EA020|nr:hypothetical protein [Spirulina sp. CS-785/01]MDB9314173.1 hypothetical protein [Spirulina sp. CS-785/01]
MPTPTILELTEYQLQTFPKDTLPEEIGQLIWKKYAKQIDLEFPSPKTGGQWQLKPKGWVGQIPLTPNLQLFIRPKVPLKQLLGMLDYAYQLRSFHWLDGLVNCETLPELYDRLARLLCDRILTRKRQGFYRTYLPQTQTLSYLRGRLNLRKTLEKPWQTQLHCHYETHTSDIPSNQILLWTVFLIARSGICQPATTTKLRQAYHALHNIATLTPCTVQDCTTPTYNRLNQDYQPLHALCRFFLANLTPSHLQGKQTTVPFLVDMARLYEQFVANWLSVHLPPQYSLKTQEHITLQDNTFNLDMVICDRATQQAICVLDTKYKTPQQAANADIYQINFYAHLKHCQQAILVYPHPLPQPLQITLQNVHIRNVTFSLNRDLNLTGQEFLNHCLSTP